MIECRNGNIAYFCFENLKIYPNLCHFVSTRGGGCSTGKFETLNLSIKLEPESGLAIENRKRLFHAVGLPIESLVMGKQTHTANILRVDGAMAGAGAQSYQSALPDTDALITSSLGAIIAVLVADCVPILLFDPVRKAIGVVHAGRAGTTSEITGKTVERMAAEFSTDPADLLVGIGPSICAKHYSVSEEAQREIRDALGEEYLTLAADGSVHFDLWKANVAQIVAAGVPHKNIEISRLCTYEMANEFYSERRDGKPTGRFCAAICMRT
ncbi:MAG: peptidoglycan editing factor PgeF [Minisyncoccota bacterium]